MQLFWLFYISCSPFSSILFIFNHILANLGHLSSCHAASLELGWESPAFFLFWTLFWFVCSFNLTHCWFSQRTYCFRIMTHSCSGCFQHYISWLGHFLCFETSPSSFCDIELWSWKERDKEVRRRKGMRDFSRRSLLSFVLKSFQLMQN